MRLLRALSLDIVAGAACGGLLAEHLAGARMQPAWWVALLAAVWSIYTADHLLDAFRTDGSLGTYRHVFHRHHARVLLPALAIAVTSGILASFALRPPVRLLGLALSALVLLYLASAQSLILADLPKELMAGVLYAAGIWGGPIVLGVGPGPWLILAGTLHALAAVLNLVMLGVFEVDEDRRQGHRSVALWAGQDRTRSVVLLAGGLGSVGTAWLAAGSAPSPSVFAVLAFQIATPAVLLLARRWSEKRERYRSWGDSVFLLGGVPRVLGLS